MPPRAVPARNRPHLPAHCAARARTPVLEVAVETSASGFRTLLKLEHTQDSGSFKARAPSPTCSCARCRRPASRASGGNHGAPSLRGAAARPQGAHFRAGSPRRRKIARIRGCGADLVVGGKSMPRACRLPGVDCRQRRAVHPCLRQIETMLGAAAWPRLETQAPTSTRCWSVAAAADRRIAAWYEAASRSSPSSRAPPHAQHGSGGRAARRRARRRHCRRSLATKRTATGVPSRRSASPVVMS